ncbi:DUF2312 domain-containing protein [Pleomorphomonas koreensis]|uniref:DUF2312 domain-containing protein n=1 Tax=Pleomorphomonas koreensis TaxID=257440 RepID=UPI0004045C3B|nr:DUF2312 domain-containing protein [Pleomorphomonas koreensis]
MKAGGTEASGGMAAVESIGGVAAGELRQFVERIERLHEERAAIGDDIKDIYAELKGRGYDVKTVKRLLQIRRMDPDARQEADAILDLYMNALGMA